MKENIINIYAQYGDIVLFLHVIAAVIWVGGMIAVRIAVHRSVSKIENSLVRLQTTLGVMKNLFILVAPFIVILLLTALIMLIGMNLKDTPNAIIGHIKEGLWTLMFINYIIMIIRRNKAQSAYDFGDTETVRMLLLPVSKFLIPLNILMGTISIYLGITIH